MTLKDAYKSLVILNVHRQHQWKHMSLDTSPETMDSPRGSALRPLHCASVEGQSQVPSACGHGLGRDQRDSSKVSAAVTV